MAKTEVILIQNVIGLGAESDQVKVSAGYARSNTGAARGHDPNKFDWPALLRKLDRIDPSYKQ